MLTDRFVDGLVYAARVHRTQRRKATEIPYISHLMSVAALVLEHGGDEDAAIAALLHDAPEDQGGEKRLDDIRATFGDRVADIVAACSDTFEEPKPAWRERKKKYHRHVREAKDPSVHLVSAADKLHNARATAADVRRYGAVVWKRFNAGRDESVWNYRELIEAYDTSDPRVAALVAELRQVVDEL